MSQQAAPRDESHHHPEYRSLFRKTVFCRFFTYSACIKGDQCEFAHTPDEFKAKPDLSKTALCRQWKRGVCHLSADLCRFAHGHQELRKPRSKQESYKSLPVQVESTLALKDMKITRGARNTAPPRNRELPGTPAAQDIADMPQPHHLPIPKWCYMPLGAEGGDGSIPAVPALHADSALRTPAPTQPAGLGEASASSALVHAIAQLMKQASTEEIRKTTSLGAPPGIAYDQPAPWVHGGMQEFHPVGRTMAQGHRYELANGAVARVGMGLA
mmetsp:Transcript_24985/g.79374  ORF Transcript_24985/g.79374 Transcript_24985/m.79374 type:complete len:271 (-) Transcript_24985:237-1049(-)